jgi:hypothetical protein
MRAEGHGDSQLKAHLQIRILTNLRPKKGVTAHLLHLAGSSRSREAQVEAGGHFEGHFRTGGFKAVKGS